MQITPNWETIIAPDGNITLTSADLAETLFLKPLYNTLQQKILERLDGKMQTGTPRSYEKKKGYSQGKSLFTIADHNIQSDIYTNKMQVSFNTTGIHIEGDMLFYKGVEKHLGVCVARASGQSELKWTATIAMAQAGDGDNSGQPQLSYTTSFKKDDGDGIFRNSCSDMWNGVKNLISFATNVVDESFLKDVLAGVVNDAATALAGLASTIPADILSGTGEAPTITNYRIDTNGRLSVDLK